MRLIESINAAEEPAKLLLVDRRASSTYRWSRVQNERERKTKTRQGRAFAPRDFRLFLARFSSKTEDAEFRRPFVGGCCRYSHHGAGPVGRSCHIVMLALTWVLHFHCYEG